MSKVVKRVLLALAVVILIAIIGACVSFAFINRSSSDGSADSGVADGDGNTGEDGGNSGNDETDGGGNTGGDENGDGGNSGGNGGPADGDGTEEDGYDGLFALPSTKYVLTSDYTLTEADVKATKGNGGVSLWHLCSFDLGGHTLDLGGSPLGISTSSKKVIKFENGKITNGKLNVSIPDGDIEFTATETDKTVTYELTAASETIRFSNAVIGGKCTVKSNTRVSVEYATVSDLTFTGNGTLSAGSGAELGAVTVGKDADGATLNIAPSAAVGKVEINAPATVTVSGTVTKLVVESSANGSSVTLNESANVETVAVKGGNTSLQSNNAEVLQVVVANSVAGTVNTGGVKVTAVADGDVDKYIGHLHVLALVSEKDATCTADGEIVYACTCGEQSVKTVPATGHDYVQSVIKEPTTSSDGLYGFECSRCKDNYSVTLSKEDAVFHRIDVAMTAKHETSYETVRLKFVSDGADEYYLLTKTILTASGPQFNETVYSVNLLANTGLPQVRPLSDIYCKDWLQFTFNHTAQAAVEKTVIDGGRLKVTEHGYEIVDGVRGKTQTLPAQSVSFSGSCFYNAKTQKSSFEDVHKITATAELSHGSTACSDGITVTKTCSVCGHTETKAQKGHYYTGTDNKLSTQCAGTNYFRDLQCIVCGERDLSYSLDYTVHTVTTDSKSILTDAEYNDYVNKNGAENAERYFVKASELSAYSFDSQGFYYGNYYLRHCAMCGINVHEFTYFTHTATDGCLSRQAYFIEYKGNVDYEAFECKGHISAEGHHKGWTKSTQYPSVSAGVAEVKTYINEDELLFEPETADYGFYQCLGCKKRYTKKINLNSAATDDSFRFEIDYDDDGATVKSWEYWYYYSLQTMFDRINNFYGLNINFDPNGSGSGHIYRSMNSNISEAIEWRDAYIELRLNRYGENAEVEIYYIQQCTAETSIYLLDGGVWTLQHRSERERHSTADVHGENCIEDGKGCIYCNKVDSNVHNFDEYWGNPSHGSGLTNSDISSLKASISALRYCYDCNTQIDAEIVLKADWTLTNDVYLRAEGIAIDLNGYSIDLNGYSLVVYSYVGQRIVITDNSFDTSNASAYTSRITNSGSTGVLAVASSDYYGTAEITFGTVAVECESFASDTDNRYTFYDSLLKEGYDLPFVRA